MDYNAWRPDLWPEGGYELVSLTDDERGLAIVLEHYGAGDTRTVYEIRFAPVRAYQSIDEGFRLRQWDEDWAAVRRRDHSAIYTVEDSDFLANFHDGSLGLLEGSGLAHYFVVTNNDCIDVLADVEPVVRVIEPQHGCLPDPDHQR